MFLFFIFYYYLLSLFHRADSHCVLKANELNGKTVIKNVHQTHYN